MAKREILISREVIEELNEGTDSLGNWLKGNFENCIIESTENIQDILTEFVEKYTGWINDDAYQNVADPYVVAVAKVYDTAVVSEEVINQFLLSNPDQIPNQPGGVKIPNVCHLEGIDHFDLVNYLVEVGDFQI